MRDTSRQSNVRFDVYMEKLQGIVQAQRAGGLKTEPFQPCGRQGVWAQYRIGCFSLRFVNTGRIGWGVQYQVISCSCCGAGAFSSCSAAFCSFFIKTHWPLQLFLGILRFSHRFLAM